MEGTTDDLEDGGSGGEVCGGGGRGGASSASGHQGSVPRGDPKERSPWGNCGGDREVCGGGRGGASSASGEGGQPRGRVGGEEGEASVDVESLFEAKDVLQKIPKSLVWNFMRYVISDIFTFRLFLNSFL